MKALRKAVLYTFTFLCVFFQTYPILWIIVSSFKSNEEHTMNPPYSMPERFFFENYTALVDTSIMTYFKNSLIVVVFTLIGIVALGALAAYPLSKMNFPGRKLIKRVFMLGIMIPVFVSLIPMFRVFSAIGIKNTHLSLIIPQVGFSISLAIYLFLGFLDYLPNSIIESGYIDGASSFRIFFSIILPLLRNTIVTIATFNFVFVWNEFIFANTFVSSNAMKTIPIGLNDFIGTFGLRDWGMTFAAITVTVLPTLLVFFVMNKQVMEGMTAGAVKA